jgi:signal transduction histidine kinase
VPPYARSGLGRRAWLLVLVAGLAGAIGLGFLPLGLGNDIAYDCIAILAVATIVIGIRRLRPDPALPWYLLAGGALAFAIGDVIWNVYAAAGSSAPYPGVADGFYLAGYPLLAASGLLLVRHAGGTHGRLATLDAAIVIAGVAVPVWVFVIEPYSSGSSGLSHAVLVAYPSMDLLLVAIVARLSFTKAWRNPSAALVAVAALVLLGSDIVFYGVDAGSSEAKWTFWNYAAVYVLWAVAALHPAGASLPRRLETRLTPVGLALMAAASTSIPAVLAWQVWNDKQPSLVEIGLATALVLLVLARMAIVARALSIAGQEERLARREAETAQRLLTEQNDRLRELDRAKDDLLGVISHDLRAPVTSIAGFASLMLSEERGGLSVEQRGSVEAIERNAGRVLRLIEDLMLATRLQTGQLALETSEVDVGALAHACAADLGPQARAAAVELSVAASGAAIIAADPARIAQVLDNLVSNALKFTPAGGRVAVQVDAAGDEVALEVADSGIGIPADELDRLFDRFYRASTATAARLPGTGLGLAIVKGIVEAHGGRVAVASEVGRGTVVRVAFPRPAASHGAAADGLARAA